LRPSLADELFAPGQPLDASELRTESATRIQELAPTRAAADKLYEERLAQTAKARRQRVHENPRHPALDATAE
jgi:hypothetical protein